MTFRWRAKTRSGQPCRPRWCSRKRNPSECARRRTNISALLFLDRTSAILRLRSAGVSVSTACDFTRSDDDLGVPNSDFDYSAIASALRALLDVLPEQPSSAVEGITKREHNRLRKDIATALERLIPLSRTLDPIKQPSFVFDPTNPEIVGQLIGRTMMEQPRHSLGSVEEFYGSGVYAIYYNGNYDAYRPIRRKDTAIYVGNADPPTPNAKTVEEQGAKLARRLNEHAKSVRAASSTLNLEDFECRYLVVQSGWQKSAEDYLINSFKPIWNARICYGFGKHGDDPNTRANTRSPWDTLHPGRPWATRAGNVEGTSSQSQIKAMIAEHFGKHPPKTIRTTGDIA